jgi:hypothetical protein|tara:strand:+ start:36768 stop:37214 length:447 start_codon:yes stop_codon:yes gene_type:complete
MKFKKRIKKKNKKGIGPVIAWILLLGFSISLAVMVFNWTRTQTEDLTESTVSYVEGKLECQEISINVVTNEDCTELTISNRGKLNIEQFAIRTFRDEYENTLMEKNLLAPKASRILNIVQSNKIEVIPIIEANDKLVGCFEKRIAHEC